jgi:hypothetical protein
MENADNGLANDKLTEAILECTRDEIRRTLFELLGKRKHPGSAAPKRRTRRPSKQLQLHRASSSPEVLPRSPLFQHRGSKSSRHEHVRVPLEVDVPMNAKLQLHRSTSMILERSVDMVIKATGRKPSKFRFDEMKIDRESRIIGPLSKTKNETSEVDPQRFDLWPALTRPKSQVAFRSSETARLIRTSPKSITNANSLRPATTALERRHWTSTVAVERNKALDMGRKLLGPITLESKRQNIQWTFQIAFQSTNGKQNWREESSMYIPTKCDQTSSSATTK